MKSQSPYSTVFNKNGNLVLESLLNAVQHPLFFKDKSLHITFCNDSFYALAGFKKPFPDLKTMAEYFDPCDKEVIQKHDQALLQSGIKSTYETHLILGGSKRAILVESSSVIIASEVYGILNTVFFSDSLKDSTLPNPLFKYTELMLKINQSMLEKTNERDLLNFIMKELYAVFGHKDCGCILINKNNHLKMISQVGYTQDAMEKFDIEMEKSYFWRFAKGNINKVYRINQTDLIEQEDYTKVAESTNGQEMLSSISAPIIIDNQLYGLINFDSPTPNAFNDHQISIMEYVRVQLAIAIKNRQLYEKTVRLSRYDQLTGLMNRHYFEEEVAKLLIERTSLQRTLILVVCDVDRLKQINDSAGHLAGDALLIACTKAIQAALGKNALVARFGGDEFVGVTLDTTESALSEQLVAQRRLLMLNKSGIWPHSFSFGMSKRLPEDTDYYSILKRADIIMYQEKELRMNGRRESDKK